MLLLRFTQYEVNTTHFLRLSRIKRSSINKDCATLTGYYNTDFQLNRNIRKHFSNTVSKIEECSITEKSKLLQHLFDIKN
jgi:hypothetical protein